MPDQELVDYIRRHKAQYGIDKLRKGLLRQGVSYADIKVAMESVESEEEEKLSEFLSKKSSVSARDEVGSSLDIDDDPLSSKADKVADTIVGTLGLKKKDKKLYFDILVYGALAFVFIRVIVLVFQYIGGRMVYPKVAADLGVLGKLALPDVLIAKLNFWHIFESVIWAGFVGGIITLVFMLFLVRFWPFKNWHKLDKRVFVFYLIFELFFGVFVGGIIISISWIYILGYIIVAIGIVIASWLASNYFASSLERKHPERVKELLF